MEGELTQSRTGVILKLKSPDETLYELGVANGGGLESGGTPVSGPVGIVKPSDQNITSQTTVQNDTALVVPVGANEKGIFELKLFVSEAANNPNLRLRMGATGGLTGSILYGVEFPTASAVTILENFTTTVDLNSINTSKSAVRIWGTVESIVAGNLQFQWAQANSDTDAMTVHAKSSMTYMKIG